MMNMQISVFGVAADGTALVCNTTYMPGDYRRNA